MCTLSVGHKNGKMKPYVIDGRVILRYKYISSHYYGLCFRGIARNGLRKGFSGQKLPKEGALSVQKRCEYAPERRFVRVLVKMTKKFGPMGGVLTPISPLGYTPDEGDHTTSTIKICGGVLELIQS